MSPKQDSGVKQTLVDRSDSSPEEKTSVNPLDETHEFDLRPPRDLKDSFDLSIKNQSPVSVFEKEQRLPGFEHLEESDLVVISQDSLAQRSRASEPPTDRDHVVRTSDDTLARGLDESLIKQSVTQ